MTDTKTIRERLDDLGWTLKSDSRSAYDRAVFLFLEELLREVERLRTFVTDAEKERARSV